MAVAKIDPKVIFASEAPAQDTPAVFTNKTVGWGESRKNGGRPTIKQSNALQQETDLKILWLNENSVTPFDSSIDYPENAVTIKDGVFKILKSGVWGIFLDKSSVGLSNVDNTSDLNKPVSAATQTALNLKADKSTTYTKVEVDTAIDLLKPPYLSSDVVDGNQTQDQINLYGGKKYDMPMGGYPLNARVLLDNGDIVKSAIPDNTNNPNADMTGWVFDDNTIESIAEMLAIENPKDGMRVFVKGYYPATNFALALPYVGGGERVYIESRASENDGFLCINGWTLIVNNDTVSVSQAGANTDFADNSSHIQKAFDSPFNVFIDGIYQIENPVGATNCKKVFGSSPDTSHIIKSTASTKTLAGDDIDCAFYCVGSASVSKFIPLEGFKVTKNQGGGADVGFGAYLKYFARTQINSFHVEGGSSVIKTYDTWMVNWNRVEAKGGNINFDLQTGTSNTFVGCWAILGKDIAWDVKNLYYSSAINCGADYIGSVGNPAQAIYDITQGSTFSLINCANEFSHAYNMLHVHNSSVNLDCGFDIDFNNSYVHPDAARQAVISIVDVGSIVNITGGSYRFTNDGTNGGVGVLAVDDAEVNLKGILIYGLGDILSNDWAVKAYNRARISNITGGVFTAKFGSSIEKDTNKGSYFNKPLAFSSTLADFGGSLSDYRLRSDKVVFTRYAPDGVGGEFKGFVLNMTTSDGVGANSRFIAQLGISINQNKIGYRWGDQGFALENWVELRSTANTTVDSNGFVKSASPIVKLFSDHIEVNDQVSTVIEFEKLGIGDYLIKGTEGFSSDGWYIELPQDANGNKLFAVMYTTLDGGEISVKTYKRKFDIEAASIVADLNNPVDIGDGRWIDIRLN